MEERIGPTEFNYRRVTCALCKYHVQEMFCSGRDPIYDHYCEHPKAKEAFANSIMGMRGSYIGQDDITPSWCPERKG